MTLGVSFVALAACGSSPSSNETGTTVVSSAPVVANELTARTIGSGDTFSLNDAISQKPVAFWFWAPG